MSKKLQEDIYWTTGGGDEILIKDMENSHLINTINYINRKSEKGFNVFVGEYGPSIEERWCNEEHYIGESAINYFEPQYSAMISEAKKRNLLIKLK